MQITDNLSYSNSKIIQCVDFFNGAGKELQVTIKRLRQEKGEQHRQPCWTPKENFKRSIAVSVARLVKNDPHIGI